MGIASRIRVEESKSREVQKLRSGASRRIRLLDSSAFNFSTLLTFRLLDSSTRKVKTWVPHPLPSPSKSRESSAKNSQQKQPLLDSRRRSELTGFLVAVVGLLVLLSLASFMPEDPSLNTATAAGATTRNWIGPVGAYTADLLFQGFGWVAYLIPMLLLVVGTRLLLVRPFEAPKTKAVGAGLLVTSLSALLELFPYTPAVRGLIHGSGMLGYLAAAGLIHTFNRVGAGIVAGAVFLSSLFLVTRFSFSWAAGFSKSALAGAGTACRGAMEGVAGSPRGGGCGAPAAPGRGECEGSGSRPSSRRGWG